MIAVFGFARCYGSLRIRLHCHRTAEVSASSNRIVTTIALLLSHYFRSHFSVRKSRARDYIRRFRFDRYA